MLLSRRSSLPASVPGPAVGMTIGGVVLLGVGVAVGNGDGLGESDGEGLGLAVGDGVGVGEAVGATVGVGGGSVATGDGVGGKVGDVHAASRAAKPSSRARRRSRFMAATW